MSMLRKFGIIATALFLTACSSHTRWNPLNPAELDQKSYAIGYSTTAQTYQDRVNPSYDINAFMQGTDDWLKKKIALPIEQIRASLLNRMLDHNIYAYYSGVLYTAELQQNFTRLSPKCWGVIEAGSLTQGIFEAMRDLQQKRLRDDDYLKQGTEEILHLCVDQVTPRTAK